MPWLDGIPFNYLNGLELIKYYNVSHMMRIGNNHHRPYKIGMESGVYPIPMEGVLLAKGRTRTHPM